MVIGNHARTTNQLLKVNSKLTQTKEKEEEKRKEEKEQEKSSIELSVSQTVSAQSSPPIAAPLIATSKNAPACNLVAFAFPLAADADDDAGVSAGVASKVKLLIDKIRSPVAVDDADDDAGVAADVSSTYHNIPQYISVSHSLHSV